MFDEAEVGDRVWDMRYGCGTIQFIGKKTAQHPISVVFDMKYRDVNITNNYKLCGRENAMHITPMLFKENGLKLNINKD
jgi:hypothetical protein